MSLDATNVINQLQSTTVRAALGAIVVNGLMLVTTFTGITFDVEWIKNILNFGITAFANAATIYLAYRAIKGRIFATKQIEPLPWLEAAKNMKKE